VAETLSAFPGITRDDLLYDLQLCYKNRRKKAPVDTLQRGSRGRRKRQTPQVDIAAGGEGSEETGPETPPGQEQGISRS